MTVTDTAGQEEQMSDRQEVLDAMEVAVTITAVLDFRPADQSPVSEPIGELEEGWEELRHSWAPESADLDELGELGLEYERDLRDRFEDLADAAYHVQSGLRTRRGKTESSSAASGASMDVCESPAWLEAVSSVRSLWNRIESALRSLADGRPIPEDIALSQAATQAEQNAIAFCAGLALPPEHWPLYVRSRPIESESKNSDEDAVAGSSEESDDDPVRDPARDAARDRMTKYLSSALERRWRPIGDASTRIGSKADREGATKAEVQRRALAVSITDREQNPDLPRFAEAPSKQEYLRSLATQLTRSSETRLKAEKRRQDRSEKREIGLEEATGQGEDASSEADEETKLEMDHRLLEELEDRQASSEVRQDLRLLYQELGPDAQKLLAAMKYFTGDNVSGAAEVLGWKRHRARQAWEEIQEVSAAS